MAVRVTTLKGTAAGIYYTHELGLGLGLYYARDEEPPGRWVGEQAEDLGIAWRRAAEQSPGRAVLPFDRATRR